jgi:Ulp1 family protease
MYLEMIAHRSTSHSYQKEGMPRITVLPTLLYTIFKEQGFEKVRRWTKSTNIFECDMSIIPVNMPGHWVLIVIDHRKKLLRLYDSKPDASTRGSRIKVILDITHYLSLQHLNKRKEEYTAISEYSH